MRLFQILRGEKLRPHGHPVHHSPAPDARCMRSNHSSDYSESSGGKMARLLQRPAVREPVQFRPRRGDGQVRSSLRHGLPGHRGPRPLRLPHGLLLPPGPPRGNHRQAQGHHHHNLILGEVQGGRRPGRRDGRSGRRRFASRSAAPQRLRQRRLRRRGAGARVQALRVRVRRQSGVAAAAARAGGEPVR